MGTVNKFILLWVLFVFFSVAGLYAQSDQERTDNNKNSCYVPGDDYKHQFGRIHTQPGRGNIKVKERNEEAVINHNYKQQAGGDVDDRGSFYGNWQSGNRVDEKIQGATFNHNYKQQAGSPLPTPGNEVVISKEVDRGC